MSEKQVNGDLKEEVDLRYGVAPRYILQVLGTEMGRKIYANTWVDYWSREYDKNFDPTEVTIITDVRFKNEIQVIKDKGGVVWKLIREDGPGASGGVIGHASEVEQGSIPNSDFDTVLTAKSGDLDGLSRAAHLAYEKLATTLTRIIE